MINTQQKSANKGLKARGCAITGKADKWLMSSPFLESYKAEIENLLRRQIFLGYHTFLSSMTMGAEIIGAQLAIKLRKEFSHIKVFSYLPCETQASHWPEFVREQYFDTLAMVDEVIYLGSRYEPGCYEECKRAMLSRASRLLYISDDYDVEKGSYALNYAKEQGIEILPLALGDICLNDMPVYRAH